MTDKSTSKPSSAEGMQTPLEETARKTGQGSNTETVSGAEPEAPGASNSDISGDPNQGTEAR